MQTFYTKILIFYLFFNLLTLRAQDNINLNTSFLKGEVFGLGWNQGGNTSQSEGFLDFTCNECLDNPNIYLIALEINASENKNSNLETTILINNTSIKFSSFTKTGIQKIINGGNHYADIHFQKVEIPCVANSFNFNIPAQNPLNFMTGFYLVVECENLNYENLCYSILINNSINTDFIVNQNNAIELNPIILSNNVGFSIVGHTFNYLNGDASKVFINNNYLGNIGGQDLSSNEFFGSGVRGHFRYSNGILIGLDDDFATPFMNGTDALSEISSYMSDNTIFFNCEHEILGSTNNYCQAAIVTYSTPCAPFDVTVTQDTVVCLGSSIQLSASGGTAYEWQPATGLSCTDCPNPIAILDSSQLYTVRIWNNDSCSVVRPVKVNVKELPAFQSVNPVATACGTETGSVVVVANNATAKPLSYSLNGGAFETSSTFTGGFTELGAGTYTLTLQDAFGCQRDTVFSIASNNTTQAQFTTNPQSGAAPLEVSFTNTSTNASNYEWFVTSGTTNTSQGSSLSSITFDTSGVYTVTLVAWQNSSACADTFSVQILVFDTLVLQIPNVFTPNNDGVNDVFSIASNLPASYTFTLLNRWGTVVASKKSTFTPNVPEFLWDGKNATDGTYFYTLEVEWENETKKVEGFVVKIGD